MVDYTQCKRCLIPKYRHPYFKDCGHDFLNDDEPLEKIRQDKISKEVFGELRDDLIKIKEENRKIFKYKEVK